MIWVFRFLDGEFCFFVVITGVKRLRGTAWSPLAAVICKPSSGGIAKPLKYI